MKDQDLLLANRVSEEIVRREPEPEFTETWRPFSHGKILDAMAVAVKGAGMKVVGKEYSVRPGSQMVAAWEVESQEKGFNFGISILNAIDKTHSVTLGCFEKLFVCSNFCFRLEWERVMFRRHSGNLEMDEIVYLARESLRLLVPKFEALKSWHMGMKKVSLTVEQTALITIAAMKRKIIPPAKYDAFNDLLFSRESKYRDHAGSIYAWHGAATELMNNNSILTIMSKQDQLNYFIDYEAPLVLEHGKEKKIDLEKIRGVGWERYLEDREAKKSENRENFAKVRQSFIDLKRREKTAN